MIEKPADPVGSYRIDMPDITAKPKITIIGAGGFVFPFRLIGDLMSFPALRSGHLCLMDINADRVSRVASAALIVLGIIGLKLSSAAGSGSGSARPSTRRAAMRRAFSPHFRQKSRVFAWRACATPLRRCSERGYNGKVINR